ncbi:DUF2892 domain-containing protein [Roseibium sp.]|uniref:YgaP family membrane protein n=1 Tax=Roseibium sp. TaxID=1936156 RepID=UPI003A9736F4
MTLERSFLLIVGTMVLASALLSAFHSLNWLWLTGFIGVNLMQFSVTGFCPMVIILKKLGLRSEGKFA